MKPKTAIWLKSLIAAVISGAANAGGASIGIGTANVFGFDVKPLDLKQLGGICVSGAIVGLILYLKQSPVPPDSTGNTVMITNPNPPTPPAEPKP